MARAKQTRRSEARRRYRQAMSQPLEESELDEPTEELAPERRGRDRGDAARTPRPLTEPQAPPRPGFGSAFRAAYHPANVREDLAALPRLLRHYAFLLPVGLIVAGVVIGYQFWFYTGGQFAFQSLVVPAPLLGMPPIIAGLLAPRASYLIGLLVALFQGVAITFFVVVLYPRLGIAVTPEVTTALVVPAFIYGPFSGILSAAAAAWYRRFLRLSSPRRAAAARQQASRASSRGSPAKRPAGR